MDYVATQATPEGKALLKSLSNLKDPAGNITLPNTLTQVTYPDKTQAWALQEQMGQLTTGYIVAGTTALDNANSQVPCWFKIETI